MKYPVKIYELASATLCTDNRRSQIRLFKDLTRAIINHSYRDDPVLKNFKYKDFYINETLSTLNSYNKWNKEAIVEASEITLTLFSDSYHYCNPYMYYKIKEVHKNLRDQIIKDTIKCEGYFYVKFNRQLIKNLDSFMFYVASNSDKYKNYIARSKK